MAYNVDDKRLHTFVASGVGEILVVSGDTFTNRRFMDLHLEQNTSKT